MEPIKCDICKQPNQHFAWVVSSDPDKESAVCRDCFAAGIAFVRELGKLLSALNEVPSQMPIGEGGRNIGVYVVHPKTVTEAEVKTDPRG